MKHINDKLYTQSAYAKKIGISQPAVNKMIKEDRNPTGTRLIQINGAVLIEEK